MIESESATLEAAARLKSITAELGMPFIFKSSYDKANRSSVSSFRGPGAAEGLRILARVGKELKVPLLSDIHRFEEIGPAAEVLDILQIPAFLCRQTDFVVAVAKTGRVVNIKKGQFLAPWDIKNAAEKALSTGNDRILITERGVSFGYNNLVADMRSLPIIRDWDIPSCSMRPIRSSCPVQEALLHRETGNSCHISPGRLLPPASTRCSWKCTHARTKRSATARICSAWMICRSCCAR